MPIVTALAVGHITHDRFDDDVLPGGCAYYACRTWKALGSDSRIISVVGDDFQHDEALIGVRSRIQRSGLTTAFTNTYPPAGPRIQHVQAQAPPVSPEMLPADWLQPDVLFLGPVLGEVDPAAWIRATRARINALGVQGYIRTRGRSPDDPPKSNRVIPSRWSPPEDLLRRLDVACLSEEDLIGQENLLDRLCENVPVVALTKERKGCDIITREGITWVGIHPSRVVDPTGAGDTFAAGLLFGLTRGQDPVDAARLGAACASIIIEGKGGAAFDRMEEAFDRARTI